MQDITQNSLFLGVPRDDNGSPVKVQVGSSIDNVFSFVPQTGYLIIDVDLLI
jgi:hypothetical protein